MPRYIQELQVTSEGGTFTIPTCSRFIGIEKVSNYFILMFEVWGNPALIYDIDLRIFHKDEYLLPEAKYIGYAVVGNQIFHFAYTTGEVIDLGGDGGAPVDIEDIEPPTPKETLVFRREAGGMKEL